MRANANAAPGNLQNNVFDQSANSQTNLECKENIPHNLIQHQAHNFHILQSFF